MVSYITRKIVALGVMGSVTYSALGTQQKPNIVFIEVDDLMYRFMGETGYGFVSTPNIDSLAKNGVYFSNAVCQGTMCGPSRNSLIIGKYPHNIGFYVNGDQHSLPKGVWSLPGALKRTGYVTSWVGKCHVHPYKVKGTSDTTAMKSEMGFDDAVLSVGRVVLGRRVRNGEVDNDDVYIHFLKDEGLFKTYENDVKSRKKVTSLPEYAYLDGFYANQAIKWINGYRQNNPFFLWVNFSCPHGPFDVPQKYHDMYSGKEIPDPLSDDFGNAKVPNALLENNKPVRPRKLDELRRGFAANVTFVDNMVGKIINSLKEKGALDNSVIFFFSDHGIFMGNHGRIHKSSLFNEVLNPSLIIYYPKVYRKGVVEAAPVELNDIVKTALTIAGASEDEMNQPYGKTLTPLLLGKGSYSRDGVFSEINGFVSCFDGRYRYIADLSGDEEPLLYDLKNDSVELNNIARSQPERAKRMQLIVDEWKMKTGPFLKPKRKKSKKDKKNDNNKSLRYEGMIDKSRNGLEDV